MECCLPTRDTRTTRASCPVTRSWRLAWNSKQSLRRSRMKSVAANSTCRIVQLFLAAALALPSLAPAQAYPARPVRWIIPYAAGGSADTRARQVAAKLAEMWGQPILIETKPGAGGVLGTDSVAKAAADGYTMGMGNFGPLAVNL